MAAERSNQAKAARGESVAALLALTAQTGRPGDTCTIRGVWARMPTFRKSYLGRERTFVKSRAGVALGRGGAVDIHRRRVAGNQRWELKTTPRRCPLDACDQALSEAARLA
jgi:hypothetical protein